MVLYFPLFKTAFFIFKFFTGIPFLPSYFFDNLVLHFPAFHFWSFIFILPVISSARSFFLSNTIVRHFHRFPRGVKH